MRVEAWLQRAACLAPTVIALQTPEQRLSYVELWDSARVGAHELSQRGVLPGERVAIALEPGIAFAQALHACLLHGAVAVPVDLRLTPAERERIVADASLLIEEPLGSSSARGGDSETFADPEGFADPEAFADSETFVDPKAFVDSKAFASGAGGVTHDLDAVCAVIYTSGTTSAARPVELTYANFLWSAIGSGVALGVDPGERWLCALPLSHVGGLSILLRSAIYATTAVVHDRFDTNRVLAALREERITLVSLVSTTLARLLDAGLRDPAHLRCALTGGGPVPASLTQRARAAGVPVLETYGLTECCSQAATAPLAAVGIAPSLDGERQPREVGAGVPLFCTRTQIAEDGEILLSGPTVARSATAADGRLHTGDLGFIDSDGFLHVSGRKADTIVSGGENVAPIEVEAVLEAHPEVIEAAVFGREDPQWGEAVSAIVVVGPGAGVGEGALREHCSARLASFKVPKIVQIVSTPLPRTRSGKLLRRDL
jgi:O-succinylbenzoic acid--CoA ligase